MKISRKIGDVGLLEKMSKVQIQNYWLELKESRFESYFFREMFDRVQKMNPNIVLPTNEEINKIEHEALNIALWEENWDKINKERIHRGGIDYSLFKDTTMWINEKDYPEHIYQREASGDKST
jgi:hypothetical protein